MSLQIEGSDILSRFAVGVGLTRYAVSHSFYDGNVNAWKPFFASNESVCLAYTLMTVMSKLYTSSLKKSGMTGSLSVPSLALFLA